MSLRPGAAAWVPPLPGWSLAPPPGLEEVLALVRDAPTTPLAILARWATADRRCLRVVALAVDWQAERQSWAEDCEVNALVQDYLLELHRELFA